MLRHTHARAVLPSPHGSISVSPPPEHTHTNKPTQQQLHQPHDVGPGLVQARPVPAGEREYRQPGRHHRGGREWGLCVYVFEYVVGLSIICRWAWVYGADGVQNGGLILIFIAYTYTQRQSRIAEVSFSGDAVSCKVENVKDGFMLMSRERSSQR